LSLRSLESLRSLFHTPHRTGGLKFTCSVIHIFTFTPSLVAAWKLARRAASRAGFVEAEAGLGAEPLGIHHPAALVDQHLEVHLGGTVQVAGRRADSADRASP